MSKNRDKIQPLPRSQGHVINTRSPADNVLTTYQRQMLQQIANECGNHMASHIQAYILNQVPHATIIHRLKRTYEIMQGW
jgi:hypothetical protein